MESICSGKLSQVPSQLAIVPSFGGMLSGNVFDSPRAVINLSSTPYQRMFHSQNQGVTGENPVRESTVKLVARSEERNRDTINHEFFLSSRRRYPQNYMADQSKLQISELQVEKFHHTFNVFMLEDKIQDPSKCLFQFSLGDNVMDQRSGDSRFGGRLKIIALDSGLYSFPNFDQYMEKIFQTSQCWTRSLRLL